MVSDSVKKLVIQNLVRIFQKNIKFGGSLADFFHAGLEMSSVKDIDLMIPYSYKDIFLQKLFFEYFYIRQGEKYKSIRLYKIFPPLLVFKKEFNVYSDAFSYIYKYKYKLNIFNINVDIFLYNKTNLKEKLWLRPYEKEPREIIEKQMNIEEELCLNINKEESKEIVNDIDIMSMDHRKTNLQCYVKTNINEKHKSRLSLYEKYKQENNNVFDNILEFKLPDNFCYKSYLNKNEDLQILKNKDSLIFHYISYGISENRKY